MMSGYCIISYGEGVVTSDSYGEGVVTSDSYGEGGMT